MINMGEGDKAAREQGVLGGMIFWGKWSWHIAQEKEKISDDLISRLFINCTINRFGKVCDQAVLL